MNFTGLLDEKEAESQQQEVFSIGEYTFERETDAALFTFPLEYSTDLDLNGHQLGDEHETNRHKRWLLERHARLGAMIVSNSPGKV